MFIVSHKNTIDENHNYFIINILNANILISSPEIRSKYIFSICKINAHITAYNILIQY